MLYRIMGMVSLPSGKSSVQRRLGERRHMS
jgi:hypothetical protein